MGNVQVLQEHHSEEELFRLYRSATGTVERTHWQLIYLKKKGYSTKQLSEVSGYTPNWVRELIRRYNKEGVRGLRDRRREHPGAPGLLTPEDEQALREALEGPAPDGTLWNGPKVARWIAERTGRERVYDQRGWEYLIRLGFTAKTPRPRHQEASLEEQEAFKKEAAHAQRSAQP